MIVNMIIPAMMISMMDLLVAGKETSSPGNFSSTAPRVSVRSMIGGFLAMIHHPQPPDVPHAVHV